MSWLCELDRTSTPAISGCQTAPNLSGGSRKCQVAMMMMISDWPMPLGSILPWHAPENTVHTISCQTCLAREAREARKLGSAMLGRLENSDLPGQEARIWTEITLVFLLLPESKDDTGCACAWMVLNRMKTPWRHSSGKIHEYSKRRNPGGKLDLALNNILSRI